MKTITCLLFAFYFLLGGILPASDFEELAKIGNLVRHYQTHLQRTQGQMTFGRFIRMHYDEVAHQQTENHDQLPFKHHSCHCMPFYTFQSNAIQLPKVFFPSIQQHLPYYSNIRISHYSASVWQPPRFA